jgi:hypothetical protein
VSATTADLRYGTGRASFDILPDGVPSLLDTFDFYRIDSILPFIRGCGLLAHVCPRWRHMITAPVRPPVFLQALDTRECLRATSNTWRRISALVLLLRTTQPGCTSDKTLQTASHTHNAPSCSACCPYQSGNRCGVRSEPCCVQHVEPSLRFADEL